MIWDSDWRVLILPVISLTAGFCGDVVELVWDGIGSRLMSMHSVQKKYTKTTLILYSHTIAYNWIVTGLIIWKLWRHHREAATLGQESTDSPYIKVIVAMVESGALYSMTLLAFAVTYGYGTVRRPSCTD